MLVWQRRKGMEIHMDGKKLKQSDSLVYLSEAICGDGNSGTDIRRRITAWANAWKKVEGAMRDRRISSKLKGKVLASCVSPTSYMP